MAGELTDLDEAVAAGLEYVAEKGIGELPSLAGCKPVLRLGSSSNNKVDGDEPAVTDNGNYIVDLHFDAPIADAVAAASALKSMVGVVEHGLFIGMTTAVIIAGKDGVYVKEASS